MSSRLSYLFSFLLLGVIVVAAAQTQGCAENGITDGFPSGTGGNITISVGTGMGGRVIKPEGGAAPTTPTYAALCGEGCTPGGLKACDQGSTSASSSSSTGGGALATGGAGGAASSGAGDNGSTSSTSAATADSSSSSDSTSASAGGSVAASGSSSGAGGGDAGGAGDTGGASSSGPTTCRISAEGDDPSSSCSAVGPSLANGPCQTSTDCGSGLGCVVSSDPGTKAGLCKPYCCGSWEDCPAQTYCAPSAMYERQDREIPVCTATIPCTLLTANACPTGQACTVVRADGSTSCVAAGTGVLCSDCPCSDGFVCSAKGKCEELCRTDMLDSCPAGSTCQGGSTNYPVGIGLCVGGSASCSITTSSTGSN